MDINQIGKFLEKVADLSQSVYWLSNPDLSQIIYISPAYEKIWGRSRQLLYDHPDLWITYLHPDDVKTYHPIEAFAKRVSKQGQAAKYDEHYRIIRPDGEVRYILDRGFPIYINEVCCGVTGFAADITERKLTEDELKKVKYQLKGAKLITSSIAHEIRTPLATIKSNVYGINKTFAKLITLYKSGQKDSWNMQGIFDKDIAELSKALRLIDLKVSESNTIINMLSTKLQSVDFEFTDFNQCSANDCITSALETFILPKDMVDKIHFLLKEDFTFWGSKTLIIHVIMNLLKNAIFYIQKVDKGEITIWLEQHESSNEIHFKDTGSGIPADILPNIFSSFFTTKPSVGTGTGLAFSKMVMQSHHGKIDCSSEEGQYTEFILSFPKSSH